MNYSVCDLKKCIVNYLIECADRPKTFDQIYSDITSDGGHRCSELISSNKTEEYANMFIMICQYLSSEYKNIYKIFRDNVPYLVYSVKPINDIVYNDMDIQLSLYNNYLCSPDTFKDKIGGMIEYIIDHISDEEMVISLESPIYNGDNLLQYLVRMNDMNKIKIIAEHYKFIVYEEDSLSSMLIDIAIENGYAEMVKILSIIHHRDTVEDLEFLNRQLKDQNHILMEQDIVSKNSMIDLQNKINKYNTSNYVIDHIFGIGMVLTLCYSVLCIADMIKLW